MFETVSSASSPSQVMNIHMHNSLDSISDPTDDLSMDFRKVVHFVFMLSLMTADVEDGQSNPILIPKAGLGSL